MISIEPPISNRRKPASIRERAECRIISYGPRGLYPNSAATKLSASLRHSINLPKPERKINVRVNIDAENSIVEMALDNRWQISI